jgi:hypothetical protein
MEGWIDELAEALGEEALTREEANDLLGAARDVAHRVERKITPLAAFLLGSSVGRATSRGATRVDALRRALETTEGLLPAPPDR